MAITIKDVLKLWPLTLGKLIAGEGGVDRIVTSVSVLEIPKETKWFKGGELQISAFYTIANDEKSQLEVLQNLNNCNCSGLVLCHVGHWLKSIPETFINLANELNFPIIVVPGYLAYIDIITPIMDAVLNKKSMKNKYALEISHEMATMLLDNKNIDHIIYSLSKSLNMTVLFFDSKNNCLTTGYKQVSDDFINEIKEYILANISNFDSENEYIEITSKLTGITILFVPVIINTKYYGTIAILNGSNLDDLDMVTVIESKYICGLAVMENIRMEELKSSAKTDYFTNLIEWNFNSQSHAIKKASELNLDISNIALVLTVELLKPYTTNKNLNYIDLQTIINEMFNTISEITKDETSINYIMIYKNRVLIFINRYKNNLKTQNFAQNLGNSIIKSIQVRMNIPVSIGIGNCYNSILKIKDSYLESIMSIEIGNVLFNQPHCTLYHNIELFALLFKNINEQKVSSAIDKLFEPLKKYDLENNTTLKPTLKALVDSHFNTSKVAEKLFIHRNTVLQRKYKICELLEYDPEEYPYRQIFELAIMLEKLIGKETTVR